MEITKKITTPAAISDAIIAFAAELSPKHQPQYVEVRREPYAKPLNCFGAVGEKVRRDGGDQVNGWIIWEHPRAFLNAEFHAVWRSPNNDLICVAHHLDGEKRILFVPEPERAFLGRRVPNRYKALTYHRIVHDFIAMSNKLSDLMANTATPITAQLLSVGRELVRLQMQINRKF
jgi:hypothetical protein